MSRLVKLTLVLLILAGGIFPADDVFAQESKPTNSFSISGADDYLITLKMGQFLVSDEGFVGVIINDTDEPIPQVMFTYDGNLFQLAVYAFDHELGLISGPTVILDSNEIENMEGEMDSFYLGTVPPHSWVGVKFPSEEAQGKCHVRNASNDIIRSEDCDTITATGGSPILLNIGGVAHNFYPVVGGGYAADIVLNLPGPDASVPDGNNNNVNCPNWSKIESYGTVLVTVFGTNGRAGAQINFSKDVDKQPWMAEMHLNGQKVQHIDAGQTGTIWADPSCEPIQ
jgi:hypothetical protein